MTGSHMTVERGCHPSRQHPLEATIRVATTAELEQIIAYWRAVPERIFGALPEDMRTPASGVDPIDGTKHLCLAMLEQALRQRQAGNAAAPVDRTGLHASASSSTCARADRCEPEVIRPTTIIGDGSMFDVAVATYSIAEILSSGQITGSFSYLNRRWVCVARNQCSARCLEVIPTSTALQTASTRSSHRSRTSLVGRIVQCGQESLVMTASRLELRCDQQPVASRPGDDSQNAPCRPPRGMRTTLSDFF